MTANSLGSTLPKSYQHLFLQTMCRKALDTVNPKGRYLAQKGTGKTNTFKYLI